MCNARVSTITPPTCCFTVVGRGCSLGRRSAGRVARDAARPGALPRPAGGSSSAWDPPPASRPHADRATARRLFTAHRRLVDAGFTYDQARLVLELHHAGGEAVRWAPAPAAAAAPAPAQPELRQLLADLTARLAAAEMALAVRESTAAPVSPPPATQTEGASPAALAARVDALELEMVRLAVAQQPLHADCGDEADVAAPRWCLPEARGGWRSRRRCECERELERECWRDEQAEYRGRECWRDEEAEHRGRQRADATGALLAAWMGALGLLCMLCADVGGA